MKNLLTASLVLAALTLAGCAAAADNKTTPPAATAELPTVAALAGTWKMTVSTLNGTGTNTNTQVTNLTLTLTATDFTQQMVVVITPTDGSIGQTTYSDTKGTYAILGDQCTLTTTAGRSSSNAFTDTTTGWLTLPTALVSTGTMITSGGKLYGWGGSVLKAQGSVNGLIGTWSLDSYFSNKSKPYYRATVTFSADTLTTSYFENATSTFAPTPDSTSTTAYKDNGNGTLTFSIPATATVPAKTQSGYYLIAGSYLLTSNTTDFGGFTKQ